MTNDSSTYKLFFLRVNKNNIIFKKRKSGISVPRKFLCRRGLIKRRQLTSLCLRSWSRRQMPSKRLRRTSPLSPQAAPPPVPPPSWPPLGVTPCVLRHGINVRFWRFLLIVHSHSLEGIPASFGKEDYFRLITSRYLGCCFSDPFLPLTKPGGGVTLGFPPFFLPVSHVPSIVDPPWTSTIAVHTPNRHELCP